MSGGAEDLGCGGGVAVVGGRGAGWAVEKETRAYNGEPRADL